MNLRQLEIFHSIMTSRSLTEASRRLHVSQPSVSAVLKRAEDQLGVALFQRLGGRLVPTPEAEQIFPEVERIFSQLQVLKRVTGDLRDGQGGYLPLVGSPTLANAVLLPTIKRFKERHPLVRFRLETGQARPIVDRIAAREFDLGLVYGKEREGEIGSEIIGSAEIVCMMRGDHALAHCAEISPRQLVGHEVITFYRGSPVRDLIEEELMGAGLELNVSVEVSFCGSACLLAEQGAGVALVDPLILRTNSYPDLVIRPLVPRRSIGLKLIYPTNRARSKLSLEFEQILKKVISG